MSEPTAWLSDFRAQQSRKFCEQGFPTRKNEQWKYTEIKENNIPKNRGAVRELEKSKKLGIFPIQLIFINGHFSKKLSTMKTLPNDVILRPISAMLKTEENRIKPYLIREFDGKSFPFAQLNSSLMTDGMYLEIPQQTAIDAPIHLIFIHTQQNEFMIHPRNIIVANRQSQVTIIEEHCAEQAQHYFTNSVTDVYAAEGAQVNYFKIQDDDLTATHVANIFVEQQKDSSVTTFCFSKGSRLEREDLSISQRARGAQTNCHGLYGLNHDDQHVDHHVHVDHAASFGTSSMLYKGILNKKSRAVFNGKVYVCQGIQQINAHQANHNLLLSPNAEVNSKPELEIYAEDVKCTHGATVGQLDSEALFYFLSRGIEKNEARQLLLHAFCEEIYGKISDAAIREYIQKRMNDYA